MNLGDRKWGGGVDQGKDDPPLFTPPPPPVEPPPALWRRIVRTGLHGAAALVVVIGWIVLAIIVFITLGPFNPW